MHASVDLHREGRFKYISVRSAGLASYLTHFELWGDRGYLPSLIIPLYTSIVMKSVSNLVSETVPEYYRNLADAEEASSTPEGSTPDASVVGDKKKVEEEVTEPKSFRADSFQLTLPNSRWRDGTSYTLSGPTLEGTNHSIAVTTTSGTGVETASQLADEELGRIRSELTHCRVLERESVQLDCGHPACRLLVVWQQPGDRKLYQEQLYVVNDGWGYILIASFTEETKAEIGEEVRCVMRSFRPLEDGSRDRSQLR